jgi:DNA-directed RNA polymerase specialized sigma24 family protein
MREAPYERLEAYRLAGALSQLSRRVVRSLPRRSDAGFELTVEVAMPLLALEQGSTEGKRGDSLWLFRVARRSAFNSWRVLKRAREARQGDQAAVTAGIEIAERLREQLTADMQTLRSGRKPWARQKGR